MRDDKKKWPKCWNSVIFLKSIQHLDVLFYSSACVCVYAIHVCVCVCIHLTAGIVARLEV